MLQLVPCSEAALPELEEVADDTTCSPECCELKELLWAQLHQDSPKVCHF